MLLKCRLLPHKTIVAGKMAYWMLTKVATTTTNKKTCRVVLEMKTANVIMKKRSKKKRQGAKKKKRTIGVRKSLIWKAEAD